MRRLTEKDDNGNWRLKGVSWEELFAGAIITRQTREKIYGALHKLLDYEETGLSPDEVERMQDDYLPPDKREAVDWAYAEMCRKLEAYENNRKEKGKLRSFPMNK